MCQTLIRFQLMYDIRCGDNYICRQNIPLRRSIRYPVQQHPMALVHLRIEVHHARKVNLIVHGFLQNIYQVCKRTHDTHSFGRAHIYCICLMLLSDTNCTYKFLATPNEQVTIVFDHFKVKADNANVTGGAYG